MRTLRISILASQDLENISDYFLERSVDAGDRFVESFNQVCQRISKFPFIGKPYSEVRPRLRGVLLMNYIVFYNVSEDSVEILRVISGYRDLQDIFSE